MQEAGYRFDLHSNLIEELAQRYDEAENPVRGLRWRLRSGVKKYAWRIVVGGTLCLKRMIDMGAATVLLACLSPLFVCVPCYKTH
jgi:lipopolysaccharide/colanic/teichoic acid biosynthesis glycosyltransferase